MKLYILIIMIILFFHSCTQYTPKQYKQFPEPPISKIGKKDSGIYAVVHRDGHTKSNKFRFIAKKGNTPEKYKIYSIEEDGTIIDITCLDHCILHETSDEKINAFIPKSKPKDVSVVCVNNQAFAFCRLEGNLKNSKQLYILVTLRKKEPIFIELKRIE